MAVTLLLYRTPPIMHHGTCLGELAPHGSARPHLTRPISARNLGNLPSDLHSSLYAGNFKNTSSCYKSQSFIAQKLGMTELQGSHIMLLLVSFLVGQKHFGDLKLAHFPYFFWKRKTKLYTYGIS